MARNRPTLGQTKKENTLSKEFVGRKREIRQFQNALDTTKTLTANKETFDSSKWLYPHVFLVLGIGGLGKSTLLDNFIMRAKKLDICYVKIDAEEAPIVDTQTFLKYLHDRICQSIQVARKKFQPYIDAIENREKVKRLVKDEEKAQKQEEFAPLVNAIAKTTGAATGPLSQITEEATKVVIHEGARSLAAGFDAIADRLRKNGTISDSDYMLIKDQGRITDIFLECLEDITHYNPLCIFIDTFEKLSKIRGFDEWLRNRILAETPYEILWVIAGRSDKNVIQDYQDVLGNELFLAPMELNYWTKADIKDYLLARSINSTDLNDNILSFIEKTSYGIPLAVKVIADMYSQGLDIQELYDNNQLQGSTRQTIIDILTKRFMVWCDSERATNDDESNILTLHKNWIEGLALLRSYDRKAIDYFLSEYSINSYKTSDSLLEDLGRNYSFIFSDINESMHQIVQNAIRSHLRSRNRSRWIDEFTYHAFEFYLKERENLLNTMNLDYVDILRSSRWKENILNLVNMAFWKDSTGYQGVETLTIVACDYLYIDNDFIFELSNIIPWSESTDSFVSSIIEVFSKLEIPITFESLLPLVDIIEKQKHKWKFSQFGYFSSKVVTSLLQAGRNNYFEGTRVLLSAIENEIDLSQQPQRLINNISFLLSNMVEDYFLTVPPYTADSEFCIETILKVLEINPDLSYAYSVRGFFELEIKNDFSSSEKSLRKSIELDTHNLQAYLNLGMNYLRQEKYEQALIIYEDSLSIEPKFFPAKLGIARALNRKGEHDQAISTIEEVINESSDLYIAYEALAQLHIKNGDKTNAIEVYERYLHDEEDNIFTVFGDLANLYTNEGLASKLLELSQMAIDRDENFSMGYVGLAAYYNLKKEKKRALQLVEEAIKIDPENYSAYIIKGEFEINDEKYHLAIATLTRAINVYPEIKDAYFLRGKVREKSNRYEEALMDLERAYSIAPMDVEVIAYYVQLLNIYKKYDESIHIVNHGLAINPKDKTLLMCKIDCLCSLEQFSDAETIALRLFAEDENVTEHLNQLALVYSYQKKYPEALNLYLNHKNVDEDFSFAVEYNRTILEIILANDKDEVSNIVKKFIAKISKMEQDKKSVSSNVEGAILYAKAGIDAITNNSDRAFNLLKRAIKKESRAILWARKEPAWRNIDYQERLEMIINLDQ